MKREKRARRKKNDIPNRMTLGTGIGDTKGLVDVHSPSGELMDRFGFEMKSEGQTGTT